MFKNLQKTWRHHARRHLTFIGTSDPAQQEPTPRSNTRAATLRAATQLKPARIQNKGQTGGTYWP